MTSLTHDNINTLTVAGIHNYCYVPTGAVGTFGRTLLKRLMRGTTWSEVYRRTLSLVTFDC